MGGSSTPVIAGEAAWFGHDDGSLRGVNRAGEVVFEHRVGTPIKTSPVVTGNLVLIHDFAGNLWCFAGSEPSSEVINAGRGGNSSNDLLKRLDADVIAQNPSVVVILVGTNDALNSRKLTSIANYRENLETLVARVREAGSQVVLATPPPCVTSLLLTRHDAKAYGDQPPESRLSAAAEAVREIGKSAKIPVVDLHREWDGLVHEGADSLIRNPANSGAKDGVHPTAEGYARLAKLVHQTIMDHNLDTSKLICFGDSITAATYPAELERLIAQ